MKIPSLLTASFPSLGPKLSVLLAVPLLLIPVGRVSAQTFTSLHSFNLIDGVYPYDGLILSGGAIYGTTSDGGTNGCGTVFSINTGGTGFNVLCNFPDTGNNHGANPSALILSGSTLYGTESNGGSHGNGAVYKVNTDGSSFTILHDFTATAYPPPQVNGDGAEPFGNLILSGNTLYGTTVGGGSSADGVVFSVGTDGS